MLEIDLFENIENNFVLELLQCMGIKTKTFGKNSRIVKTGSKIDFLGVILDGNAQIIKKDPLGKDVVIENLKTNDIFGHDIVCAGTAKSPVDIISKNNCEVLFLPFEKVVTPCAKLCPHHLKLIKNIMKMISNKNSLLNSKIDIIAQKTTQDKILAFLTTYSKGEKAFSVPYSREEMAKFLCVDRCAMSRELSKMQKNGIIKFHKNSFELCNL